jgi:Domain of unknown function (DUF1996)
LIIRRRRSLDIVGHGAPQYFGTRQSKARWTFGGGPNEGRRVVEHLDVSPAWTAVRAAALVVAGLALSSCSGSTSDGARSAVSQATTAHTPGIELLQALAGPQGRVPQFIAECFFSHASFDDTIVYPGEEGASHLHHFFGNQSTNADSTYASLIAAQTTCNDQRDTAAYWTPALLDAGKEVEPVQAVAYYRPGLHVDATSIVPFPPDMRIVSRVAGWACGSGSERSTEPPDCSPDFPLELIVVFPDCWNGADIDSPEHNTHVAYSTGGACPSTHPAAIPQLTLAVEYPVSGEGRELSLSSGELATAHADFINSWDQDKLADDVKLCLHRKVVCGVSD